MHMIYVYLIFLLLVNTYANFSFLFELFVFVCPCFAVDYVAVELCVRCCKVYTSYFYHVLVSVSDPDCNANLHLPEPNPYIGSYNYLSFLSYMLPNNLLLLFFLIP